MRKPASYPPPKYSDPNDKRMVQVIQHADTAQPRAVNVLGVPFDGAVLGRRGARDGPTGIRQGMAGFSNYNVELGVGLEDARVFDLGDLVLENDDVPGAHAAILTEVASSLRDDALLTVLGGDNSISLPSISACAEKFGKTGLVVIDSHLDLRGEIGGKPTSGSSYGLAVERGLVDPRNVVEIGVHGFQNSRFYVEKAKGLGVAVYSAEDVSRRGPKVVARDAYRLASKGMDAVYLSLDLDAIDLAQVSGVSAPSAGGMWARNAFAILNEVAKVGMVRCADMVELAPSLDPSGRSERVAAGAFTYLIAGFHNRR